ncbi:hypothetical protein DFQ29_007321 [Apophysomyces sp. BC1021]|nr:hypothetical protein DFQ29_007321 [Apophysomyces sp. BC1021]
MFRSRSRSQHESSLSSGKASIISAKPESSLPPSPPSSYSPPIPASPELNHSKDKYFAHDTKEKASPPKQEDNVLTIESMSAVIAAAVQMSATTNAGGAPSSLSMGWKKHEEPAAVPEEEEEDGRTSGSSRSSSGGGNVSPRTSSGSSSSNHGSARFTWLTGKSTPAPTPAVPEETSQTQTTDTLDDGRDELLYRGIHVKEIKSTLKLMVIPDDVRNPMPEVKLERPGFARINY